MKLKLSAISLIVSNLVPVYGVISLGWSFGNIIFLYWFENVVIGFYTILKMWWASGLRPVDPNSGANFWIKLFKLWSIGFFSMHFGGFTMGHGIFLWVMFGQKINFQTDLLIAIGSLFVSHGISFFGNYIQPQTYLRAIPALLMFNPYPRIIVVHLTVIASGFLISGQDSTFPLIIFTLLKTGVDLSSHLFEHKTDFLGTNPVFEKKMVEIFRKSVETGKWAEISKNLDPAEREKVESFYITRGVRL